MRVPSALEVAVRKVARQSQVMQDVGQALVKAQIVQVHALGGARSQLRDQISKQHDGRRQRARFRRGDAGGRGDALGRTKPGRGHIYYERDDVDAEIEVEDDLFPDTDDEEEEF